MFKYLIGEKTYVQKPLVLGQIGQLIDILKDIKIPNTKNPFILKEALGKKIYPAIAIVIVEEGKSPKRDLEEIEKIADDIEWGISPIQVLEVIDYFFDCNPIASFSERLRELKKKIWEKGIELQFTTKKVPNGSESSSSSSPGEKSQSETPSSGDTLPENANPSSDTF